MKTSMLKIFSVTHQYKIILLQHIITTIMRMKISHQEVKIAWKNY